MTPRRRGQRYPSARNAIQPKRSPDSTGDARQEDMMRFFKQLAFIVALGAIASNGLAHADTLSDGRSAIDAWITTLGGITLSNQPVPSDFPNKLKTALEKLPCHNKAEVAKVESYVHDQINNLQHTHKVKIEYGLNTECRPAPGAQAAKDKPPELRTAARVWITGYKDYNVSMDTDKQGCTKAQILTSGARACLTRNTDKVVSCKGSLVQCCNLDSSGKPTGSCVKI
jgi:hypothetical protein